MRLEHHLVGGYVRYISPYIIIIVGPFAYMWIEPEIRMSIVPWAHYMLHTTADLGPKFRGGQMLSGGAYLRAQNVSGGFVCFVGLDDNT